MSYAFFPSTRGDAAPLLNKNEEKDAIREQLARDIAAYLKAGGTITHCAKGVSAMDGLDKSFHLTRRSRAQELVAQKKFHIGGSRPRNLK